MHYHSVDNSLSKEDEHYIPLYLNNIKPQPLNPKFEDQLQFISSVQQSVLKVSMEKTGIPFGKKREPKELYEAQAGLCYDRSRVIEKILRYSGFKTRHIAIFSKVKTNSTLKSLITPGVSSHAVTEVLTKNGWLVVDSVEPWISIDINNKPISIHEINYSVENDNLLSWRDDPPTPIYLNSFTYIIGLYSRHGNFYPPYNFIPDIHYGELIQNIM